MRNDIAKVPYIGVEFERCRSRRIIKLLAVLLALVIILAIVSNVIWKIKYDEVTDGESGYENPPTVIHRIQDKDNFVRKRRKCAKTLKTTISHGVSG